jgi:alkaline phosphatase D
MKRRDFLSLLSIPALAGLNPFRLFGQQKLPDPAELLRAGPMLGHSEITAAEIWLQTTRSSRAAIRFWKKGDPASARLSEVFKTNEDGDLIARFGLDKLEFGTHYEYEVYLDGRRVALPHEASFQTQKMWRWRTKADEEIPPFKIAIGSCAYINDSDYDRPGTPYGGDYQIFQTIAAQKPDAMIWLGDNIYYREADWLNETAMRYRYAHGRALPEMQALLASTHHYAIWDDHDFGPNNSDRAYRTRETSLKIFKDYWANAVYGTAETPGVFGRFEWSDVEFFLVDDRFYRTPHRTKDEAGKLMFGAEQMQWLKDALVSSSAPFKIIANGSQMLNKFAPDEGWAQYAYERNDLIEFIRENRVNGVLFITGDRHYAELIRRDEPGLYPLYDFTSSPLTSGQSKPSGDETTNPDRVPGTLVTGVRNFGLLEGSGTAKDRKLVLRLLDASGKEHWRHEIRASDLTFRNEK